MKASDHNEDTHHGSLPKGLVRLEEHPINTMSRGFTGKCRCLNSAASLLLSSGRLLLTSKAASLELNSAREA